MHKKNKIILYFFAVIMAGAIAGCDDASYSKADLSEISIMAAAVNQNYDPALTASEAQAMQEAVRSIFKTALTRGSLNEPDYVPDSTIPQSVSASVLSRIMPVDYSAIYEGNWHGPDLMGWWTNHTVKVGGYEQTLRIRRMVLLHAFEYELTIAYNANGVAFSYQDRLYWGKDSQGAISGYYTMKESTRVHSTVFEEVEWNFNFSNWSPATGAGTFAWSWGASASGNYDFDYHQFLTIVAAPGDVASLHTDAAWYDNYGAYLGSFEYETPFITLNISPSLAGN